MISDHIERFWKSVEILGPNECWRWKGTIVNGQGMFCFDYRGLSARRISWELIHNQIAPKGIHIHISCKTTDCCNPAHIFLATLEERFKRGFTQIESDKCWEWEGARQKFGYGVLNQKGKIYLTHRLSWEYFNGAIPKNTEICHKCDNPPCVNPNHLFLGTHKDNITDSIKKGRNPKSNLTEDKVKHIIELIKSGKSKKDILKDFEISISCLNDVLSSRTWKHLNLDMPILKPNISPLTEKDVLEIKYLLSLEVPMSKLVKKFNVSSTTISNIKYERTWKHVK